MHQLAKRIVEHQRRPPEVVTGSAGQTSLAEPLDCWGRQAAFFAERGFLCEQERFTGSADGPRPPLGHAALAENAVDGKDQVEKRVEQTMRRSSGKAPSLYHSCPDHRAYGKLLMIENAR